MAAAGPVPQQTLYNALSREQQRQQQQQQQQRMTDRSSQDILLDEEGIALNDLSHQRSPNTVGIAALNDNARPGLLNAQFASTNNVAQRGWRRGTQRELTRRDTGTDVLALGRLYQRMGKLSIIPRYLIYIVPMGALIAVPLVIGACVPELELGVLL